MDALEASNPLGLGKLTKDAWMIIRERQRRALLAHGHDRIGPAQFEVLFHLDLHVPDQPTRLADRVGVSKQALDYVLRELEEQGYIQLRVDESDRRNRLIELTSRGRDLIMILRADLRNFEADVRRLVGEAALDELRSTLRRIVDSLGTDR